MPNIHTKSSLKNAIEKKKIRLIKTENEMLNDFLPNLTFLKNLTNPKLYFILLLLDITLLYIFFKNL